MADGATQHAFSPTVLRERAKRLEWLSNDRFYVAVEELRADAADLRLLADLLDAIDTMRGRLPHPDAMTAFAKGRLSALDELSAVLEAHHD